MYTTDLTVDLIFKKNEILNKCLRNDIPFPEQRNVSLLLALFNSLILVKMFFIYKIHHLNDLEITEPLIAQHSRPLLVSIDSFHYSEYFIS